MSSEGDEWLNWGGGGKEENDAAGRVGERSAREAGRGFPLSPSPLYEIV